MQYSPLTEAVRDWSHEFPGLAKGTYLNSCAHGLLPRRTRRAIDAHMDLWERDPDWNAWGEAVETARRAFARLIGARPEDVSVQASASTGVSAVMSALPRGRIVTLDVDFPTSGFVAERQRTRGLEHEHVRTGGFAELDAWAPRIEGAALACIPAVASFSGHRLDHRAFVERAHAKGVPVMVDAFQALGTYPIDVRRDDVDFLVSGVYKWLLAPAGLAFLYARPDHHTLAPTTGGWHAARTPSRFDPLEEQAPDARRFQYGGANVLGCAALAESLALLEDVGVGAIEKHNGALVERIASHARERGWEVVTPSSRASILTFRVPDLERALAACAREGVVLNPRLGGLRVSPHFYNSAADVDRLFEVLDAAAR